MNADTSVSRKDQNRQWSQMPHKNQRRLTPVKLVPRKSPQLSDQSLRASAHSRAKQGDYAGAIALFNQLIMRNPVDPINYNNRGLIYFQSGQHDKALADYNKALELNPELDSAYNNRANYYASTGQLAEALTDYEQALDLNPGNTRTWINQGITFRELGLYDLALENLDMALILGCLEDYIYAERGRTYHLRGDWNCAIADYQRALSQLSHSGSSSRLRRKVETWMSQLLKPLSA
ncbi:MAG: tetratricopeptide repeat protein [Symplocastrum torsivum CPER-KK1]|uniref:Tetratricopeptide repeat protein n=1 Tax=Symplocastrum torsivum CPER-KK1 TaxID=450513 RepID=A0A951PSH7_9CYAN|nr:tetratricopeptide repeat protein [Symplocastrum torsivum CPER-KK1]